MTCSRRSRAALVAAALLFGSSWTCCGGIMSVEAETSEAAQQYNPAMARAFAALSTMAYCAGDFPRGVPWAGLRRAVAENCGERNGSFCRAAGLAVVNGSVKFVNLPDLNQSNMLFAIIAQWKRTSSPGAGASWAVPEAQGCLVAIRGSIGWGTSSNWKRNGDTKLVDTEAWPNCYKCRATGGHYKIWQLMEAKVVEQLSSLGCTAQKSSPIYVTGHSLGGAVAYMAMYALKRRGFAVQISYTFMSPKPGNSYFSTAFSALFNREVPIYHVTHGDDGTPTFPHNSKYKQVPFQVYYRGMSPEDYTVCYDPSDELCGLSKFMPTDLQSAEMPAMVSPHCKFPEAPYGNLGQFMARGLGYAVGPVEGAWAYKSVCVAGGLMPYPARMGLLDVPM